MLAGAVEDEIKRLENQVRTFLFMSAHLSCSLCLSLSLVLFAIPSTLALGALKP